VVAFDKTLSQLRVNADARRHEGDVGFTTIGSRFDGACRSICGSIVRSFPFVKRASAKLLPTKRSLEWGIWNKQSANACMICESLTGVAMVLLIDIGWLRNAKFWLRLSPLLPA
jgi:hypothetical protein